MTAGAGAGGAAAAAAAAAAAQRRRRMRREEEERTPYTPEDLDGWEFKILRSSTRSFRDAASMRAVLEEEARAGWELVEKFDDHRVRLKRRIECRERDGQATVDPYRTWVGMKPGIVTLIALGVTILFVGLVVLAAALAR